LIPFNDLSRKSSSELSKEIQVIEEVLKSGHYLKGKFTKEFEDILSKRIGTPFTLALGNGTDSLQVAFQSLGLKAGDLVAVTANSGGYATTAAKILGLEVGLVDVEESNHQMSPDSLLEFLELFPMTRAVVVTHLYGQIGEITEIQKICQSNNIYLVEDCAQSFGAKCKGIEAGGFGDASTFSFYPTKNLGSSGDAGAVAFKQKNHFELAKKLSQYGWSTRYSVDVKNGMNSRMDEIQAALLILREKNVDQENLIRRKIIDKYKKAASENVRVIGAGDTSFVGHLAVVVSNSRNQDLIHFSSKKIDTAIHYPILDSEQFAWRDSFVHSDIKVSEKISKQIYSIPCFPTLTDLEINKICKALGEL